MLGNDGQILINLQTSCLIILLPHVRIKMSNLLDKSLTEWDAFLLEWPHEKLKVMTLEQYTSIDDKNTFTYWLEQRLKDYGGIRGGSAYKFMIYHRNPSKQFKSRIDSKYQTDGIYAWESKWGDSANQVFERVKYLILQIVDAITENNLATIEDSELLSIIKWKIAFLYQSRVKPILPCVFKKEILESYLKEKPLTMTQAYEKLRKTLTAQNILSESEKIWEHWAPLDRLGIWKISHDEKNLYEHHSWLNNKKYLTIHKSTKKSQPEKFIKELKNGHYVYLKYNQKPKKLVQIVGDELTEDSNSPLGEKWLLRKYKVIDDSKLEKAYKGIRRRWSPDYNNTLGQVKTEDLSLFEDHILKPYFNLSLESLIKGNSIDELDITLNEKNTSAEIDTNMACNTIYFGPPGTGKTFHLQEEMAKYTHEISGKAHKCFRMVTFHQSYGYEEFIEGMRAKTTDSGNIHYSVEPGLLKKLCEEAREYPQFRYALFIDEINRGNVSKILGELITLIEPDKRQGENNALSTILPYSGEPFSVPRNLDIIGTMNTADRSLTLIDTALRRRFDFIEMHPQYELLEDTTIEGINLAKLLKSINRRIEYLYDREHCLGHAFFMPLKELANQSEKDAFEKLTKIFRNKIVPLLQEYFYEDWNKIRLVLADNQKPLEHQFILIDDVNNELYQQTLFGKNHGLDEYDFGKPKYTINASAFMRSESYKHIINQANTLSEKQESEHDK